MSKVVRRKLTILCAVAFVAGLGVALVGASAEYQEVGHLADGAYLVDGDGAFRVVADEPVGVLVYAVDGELIEARTLEAGEQRTFVLTDGTGVVALLGGQATLEAREEGEVRELPIDRHTFTLLEADGPVKESLTVQLPPMLVGVEGAVDGTAENLVVEAHTKEGVLFQADQAGLANLSQGLTLDALDATTVDVTVTADRLDGKLLVSFLQPPAPELEHPAHSDRASDNAPPAQQTARAGQSAQAGSPPPSAIPLANATGHPIALSLEQPATVVFDIQEGYLLDASVYDDDGATVEHIHRGPPLAEARSQCEDLTDCWWEGPRHESLAPERIELELGPGEHLLYVRAGAVDGILAVLDHEGHTLLGQATFLEPSHLERTPTSEALDLRGPVLDVLVHAYSTAVQERLTVAIDEGPVYRYASNVNLAGEKVSSVRDYDPAALGTGTLTITYEGLDLEGLDGRPHIQLVTVAP